MPAAQELGFRVGFWNEIAAHVVWGRLHPEQLTFERDVIVDEGQGERVRPVLVLFGLKVAAPPTEQADVILSTRDSSSRLTTS